MGEHGVWYWVGLIVLIVAFVVFWSCLGVVVGVYK